jgi:O-antigen biosynthesis protein
LPTTSQTQIRHSRRTRAHGELLHSAGNGFPQRPTVKGKFLFLGDEKFLIKGVTYGAFHANADGQEYHDLELVDRDFNAMAANGFNTVRIPHTMPPRSLLDIALRHRLHVMVGLSAEQYVGYLIDKEAAPDIEELVRAKVRLCAGHPAVLCYALGNEIPGSIARWHGRGRIERYLERLYRAVKTEDPDGLVTYVNYPTTEYLQLPFLDLACFNVYLESQDRLSAYLDRLQNIVGDRPLLMTEIGLDSLRHGEAIQALALDWQVRTAFARGCAGACIFSWTDEWCRGGRTVEDWAFGLTDRQRRPKPALKAVREAFAEAPFPKDLPWPRISVILCTYNGAATLRDCLNGLLAMDYPNFEVIVVNDGSTDSTAAIVQEYGFKVIRTENRGLSSARNTGLQAASGEIVAFIDDDAYPDCHWLTYLATTFMNTTHAGVGGPNIPPPGDGAIAECVANAPGGPIHVLLSDQEAEHIPGCNMAYRTATLRAIGGFDTQFRTAGDDVDICWRLQERGQTLGFSPAAVVWHHRRNSVRTYWKQQKGYGKAEALLEQKWPEKYNSAGHPTWAGRVYSSSVKPILGRVARIYHGIWGAAPFQSLYQRAPSTLQSLPLMPEWYLVIMTLAALSALGAFWRPLLWTVPFLVIALTASLARATVSAARSSFSGRPRSRMAQVGLKGLTAVLHILQPLARLSGRLQHGLTPWRRWVPEGRPLFRPRVISLWSERWQTPEHRVEAFEKALRGNREVVLRGGEYDRWDLEVRGGLLASARLLMAVEEHGAGSQYIRFRLWPRYSPAGLGVILLFATLSCTAALDGAGIAAVILGMVTGLLALATIWEGAGATTAILRSIEDERTGKERNAR